MTLIISYLYFQNKSCCQTGLHRTENCSMSCISVLNTVSELLLLGFCGADNTLWVKLTDWGWGLKTEQVVVLIRRKKQHRVKGTKKIISCLKGLLHQSNPKWWCRKSSLLTDWSAAQHQCCHCWPEDIIHQYYWVKQKLSFFYLVRLYSIFFFFL